MPLITVRRVAVALPIVFCLHVLEEAPGFVTWFNGLVTPPITERSFLSVNAAALAITCVVALLLAARPPVWPVGVAWVGFLMLANGLFHLLATLVHGRYCPGVVTGTLLYLPMSAALILAVVRERRVSPLVATAVALAGGVPMYIHGYLIVFRGSRLF